MIVVRIKRSRLRGAALAAVLFAAVFSVGSALADHDTDVIHACANQQSGALRLVDAASDCRSNETAVEWNRGAAIPTPQACPAGQFVTGINGDGLLTCATPGTDDDSGEDPPAGACGNGVVEEGEQCDGSPGCSDTCLLEDPAVCGDGTVDEGETCDDGNATSGDGCSDTCTLESTG